MTLRPFCAYSDKRHRVPAYDSFLIQASFTHDFQRDGIPCAYPAATAQGYRFRCQEYRQWREFSKTGPAEGGLVHAALQGDNESPHHEIQEGEKTKTAPGGAVLSRVAAYAATRLSIAVFASLCAFAATSGPYATPSAKTKLTSVMPMKPRKSFRYGTTRSVGVSL